MAQVVRKSRLKPEEDLSSVEEGRVFIHSTLMKILDHHDDVRVDVEIGTSTVLYKVSCNPADIGRLIGNRGKTIGGLRAVVGAIMGKKGQRSVIEIPFIAKKETG